MKNKYTKKETKAKKNTWGKLQCFKEKDKKNNNNKKYVKNDNFGKKEKQIKK